MTEPDSGRSASRVTIAYVHEDMVGAAFAESLLRMVSHDANFGGRYLMHEDPANMGGPIFDSSAILPVWGRGQGLDYFRNVVAEAFLRTDSDWLLWIDTDMGWQADALDRLMAVADPVERPIVGGLCFVEQLYEGDFKGGLRTKLAPTIYDWLFLPNGEGYKLVPRVNYARGEVTQCAATGTGFLLTHRSVFERISDWCQQNGAPRNIWYERIPGPTGAPSGEDISFCMRAGQLQIPIYVHTGLKITHQKTSWLSERDFDERKAVIAETGLPILPPDQWPQILVNRHAVADAREASPLGDLQGGPMHWNNVKIVVPVLSRPHNALTFMHSLRESGETADVVVMADMHDFDTVNAWRAQPGVTVHQQTYRRQPGGSFAQKVNRAYQLDYEALTNPDWYFIVGDDVRFTPGWLSAAMAKAAETGARVVGTNDKANSAVMSGVHATHFFIRTDYIREQGASWDGPGIICHEGYHHWYVDNEIIDKAKWGNEWTPCLDSVVEHRHPIFGTAPTDATYELGRSRNSADATLYRTRSAIYNNKPEEPAA